MTLARILGHVLIGVFLHRVQADDDGDEGIDIFEFEDLILQLLEDKCGVVIRPKL